MKQKTNIKRLVLGFLLAGGIFWGCQAQVEDLTGPSSLGNILGIQGLFGGAGIQNDGVSQATIKVEVFRSEEHTSELQSRRNLVCRLLLEKKKNTTVQCARRDMSRGLSSTTAEVVL